MTILSISPSVQRILSLYQNRSWRIQWSCVLSLLTFATGIVLLPQTTIAQNHFQTSYTQNGGTFNNATSCWGGWLAISSAKGYPVFTLTGGATTTGIHGVSMGDWGRGGLIVEEGSVLMNTGEWVDCKGITHPGRASVGSSGPDRFGNPSIASAIVTGPGSVWHNTHEVYIGAFSDTIGTLTVGAGGLLTGSLGVIGGAGSQGTVTVVGANGLFRSTWDVGSSLFIGYGGKLATGNEHAELQIQNGGLVNVGDATSGYCINNGLVTVSGVNGEFRSTLRTGEFYVAPWDTGSVSVLHGGLVQVVHSGTSIARDHTDAFGEITVQGVFENYRSSWENKGVFSVGGWGTGVLNIEDGGLVVSETDENEGQNYDAFYVGAGSVVGLEDNGFVTVRGTNDKFRSTLNVNNSLLIVGAQCLGILSIEQGALATSHESYIGWWHDGDGTVAVTGTGSEWLNSGDMILAGWSLTESPYDPPGLLEVSDGGYVQVGGTLKLHSNGTLKGNAGTVQANVLNSGTVAPGSSTGILTINGNLTHEPTGTVEIEIGGIEVGTQYDQLIVTGDVHLTGSLDLTILEEFEPGLDQTFDILSVGGSFTGIFSGLPAHELVGSFGKVNLYIDYHPGGVTLYTGTQPATPATVNESFVYHSTSAFATDGVSAALDTVKSLAREGIEPQTLGFDNLINSSLGISGLVFDMQGLWSDTLTPEDFEIQMSPLGIFDLETNPPGDWEVVTDLFYHWDIEVIPGWTSRVVLTFPNSHEAKFNRWLRITIKSNDNTGLAEPEVFYIGHLLGEMTGHVSGYYSVSFADVSPIRSQVGSSAGPGSMADINKNGAVSFADISAMRSNIGTQLTNISIPAKGN